MRRFTKVFLLTPAMLFTGAWYYGCKKLKVKSYPRIKNEYLHKLDDSIAFCDIKKAPLSNNNRGFRGETYITLGRDEAFPDSKIKYTDLLEEQLARHGKQNIRIMQVYVYLLKKYLRAHSISSKTILSLSKAKT